MALIYEDIITSETLLQDEQYKMNLYKQIEEMLEFEPSAYEVHEVETLVDLVNEANDILEEFEEVGTFDDTDVVFEPQYLWMEIEDYTQYSKEHVIRLNQIEGKIKNILEN
jgi:hypothetical protein